jgi:hypothetical protein
MYQPIQITHTIPTVRNSFSPAAAGRGFILVALGLASFALSSGPEGFGVTPAPDGGYPNDNTAEGTNALFSLTSASNNTTSGFQALFHNSTGTTTELRVFQRSLTTPPAYPTPQ